MYPYHKNVGYDYLNHQQTPSHLDQRGFDARQFSGFFPSTLPTPPPLGPPGPPSQGPTSGPPTAPPPTFVPQQQVETFAVDPGGIARCLFNYTYVWLRGAEQFWFYPIFVGRTSVAGYRWTGFNWVYFGIDLRQIQSFTCF
ncbi:hypothetical protein [Priestia filamentosa]|uniref:Uncharacterized protein n=1 Tax=Priestia filamentosa TaxID=1402861 RepID=A0A231S010_9BACI|nr:hypothetical protein [Priestia filamentosa]AKO90942.1 hypothetical protein BEH_01640 [Priestia filamentosa]AVD54277.1 hypothetical protein CKF96_01640 [Priestia filamentosa]MDT3766340.1 hypothetical protein [Priestia filamentosa]OXS64738.1 hypothetical protein B1B01_24970 [Priestia filamentosa]RJS65702.1 hypothetical protein CJ485_13470 [Priestia filamentosa]